MQKQSASFIPLGEITVTELNIELSISPTVYAKDDLPIGHLEVLHVFSICISVFLIWFFHFRVIFHSDFNLQLPAILVRKRELCSGHTNF